VSGPAAEAGSQRGEGAEVVLQNSGDLAPVVFGTVKGELEGAEETDRAWDGGWHKSEFSEDALLLLVSHVVCIG
jgi:hypothetical protein